MSNQTKKLEATNDSPDKPTPEQTKNWRKALFMNPQIGLYAFIMSDNEVQVIKDHLQNKERQKHKENQKIKADWHMSRSS